jgi:hypothetical protein
MILPPTISINIQHDIFDIILLFSNIVLGIVAIYSLWISRLAFKKGEFDSAMNTSPSIILRPKNIWVGVKDKQEYAGYGVMESGDLIKKDSNPYQIKFCIEFECSNSGRGTAFNISSPFVSGMDDQTSKYNKQQLYQTTEDGPFEISLNLDGTFEEFYSRANKSFPVRVYLDYTNDQNNVYCRSTWEAMIQPLKIKGDDLEVKSIRVLQRRGKIEYSQKPYKN